MSLLDLSVTSIDLLQVRVYGGSVHADFAIHLARPDGVAVDPRAQAWTLDLSKYPDMAAAVDTVKTLATNAYLFEAQLVADPGQAYTPPPPPDPAPEPVP